MPLTPSTKLGNYKILASIGAGGMGEVYVAEDRKLSRKVALKVLPPEMAARPNGSCGSSEKPRRWPPSTIPTSSPSTP